MLRGTIPAPCRAATSTVPDLNRCSRAPTFTANTSARNGFLKPFFGKRRCIGIWPPSKPKRAPWWPVRAFWPLTPLPDCSPVPEPGPRPMRLRLRVAPRGPFNVCSVDPIWLLSFLHPHHVRDGANHATHREIVSQRHGDTHLRQPEGVDGPLGRFGAVDAAPDQGHANLLCHGRYSLTSS